MGKANRPADGETPRLTGAQLRELALAKAKETRKIESHLAGVLIQVKRERGAWAERRADLIDIIFERDAEIAHLKRHRLTLVGVVLGILVGLVLGLVLAWPYLARID